MCSTDKKTTNSDQADESTVESTGDSTGSRRGCVHVYTGDGKGKTTAALGLALRAGGAGMRVFIAQFAKGRHYSELESLARLSDVVTVRQYGQATFITGAATAEDIRAAREGLSEAREMMLSGRYEVVILDEANIATYFELFSVDDLLGVIEAKPENVELVITGRNADAKIIERGDLVTEMRQVKHYYEQGVPARRGIED